MSLARELAQEKPFADDFQIDEESLIYVPAPSKPQDFDKKLADICGLSPLGEPWLRVVWGMDRKQIFGGKEQVLYIDAMGKFVGMPFWILEGWSPSEVYDEAEWEIERFDLATGEDILGAFPRKGVWDLITVIRTDDFEYAPPEMALEMAREWAHNNNQSHASKRAIEKYKAFHTKRQQKKAQIAAEARAEQREYLRQEFSKPDKNAVQVAGKYIEVKNISREENKSASGGILPASSFKTTPAGLIIPAHLARKGN